MNKKMMKTPPLPFQGNKTRWNKIIIDIINKIDGNCSDYVFVDMFGGSGIVSHWIKHLKPKSTVIYNDYDNYCERLKKINDTNDHLKELRQILKDYKVEKKITKEDKNKVLDYLNTLKDIDLITISSNILFSRGGTSYCKTLDELKKATFYNNIRKTDISSDIDEYLKGLEITHKDWKELYEEVKDKYDDKKIIYIMDPPYLYADKSGYNDKYWKLSDTILLLKALFEMDNFMFFNGDKSSFNELLEIVNGLSSNPIKYTLINKDAIQTTNKKIKRYEYMIITNSLIHG